MSTYNKNVAIIRIISIVIIIIGTIGTWFIISATLIDDRPPEIMVVREKFPEGKVIDLEEFQTDGTGIFYNVCVKRFDTDNMERIRVNFIEYHGFVINDILVHTQERKEQYLLENTDF